MTQWGMLLLLTYIVLGATGRLTWRQAGRVALAVTVIVVGAALIGYSKKTPTDKYIRSIDATVYATGNPASNAVPSTENLAGVKAATWSTTDHSNAGLGTSSGSSTGGGG